MSVTAITLSNDNFSAEVLEAKTPVLVDFHATWCQPCKMLNASLEQVMPDYEGNLALAKLDVDEARDLVATYGIRGVPTMMVFKGGEVVATKTGALSAQELKNFIDKAID